MAPLTGGCHYSWDCTKYTQDCNQCPAILDTNFKEIAKNNLEIKWSNLENLPITIVTPSEVLYHQARSSRVFKNKKIVKILLPFDPDRFMSHDRLEAKKYFNLPQKKIILFISASSLNDERKGIRFLKPIFDELIKIDTTILQNVHLLISGHEGSEYFSSLPLPFTYVGYLDNYYEIPLAFAASNIFISTSIQDSGPSMINQALMSGIPVVSFNMGIAFDLVIDNITGYRVDINDFHGFASKLSELIKIIRADERTISTNCRNIALEFCSPQKVISEFSYLL
jgi:glycosyltransferase involved in cell wall biosynthesis